MTDYLVSLKGKLVPAGQAEDFIHTVGCVSSSSPAVLAQAVHDTWDSAWAGPAGTIGNAFPATTTYIEVTVAQILDKTLGTLAAATHVSFVPPLAGSNLTAMQPTQLALAVSLRAGTRANGTPLKGRTYLPTPAVDTIDGANGHLKTSYQTSIGDGYAGFVQGMLQLGHGISVWSRKEGRLAQVQEVRMGNQVDTIRSRRNVIPETYMTFPIDFQ